MGEIRSLRRRLVPGEGFRGSGWIERTGMWGVYKSEPIN